ncbi:MAG: dephospho-CoA kinase [Gammaproteobacteria bacterium]|nr:MAG: dephospho-CoA kinase [Gammaproteobacteria bacterium]
MSNFIIGLTGGIGSGKTTIANMFAEFGIDLIDADIIARQVVAKNSPALDAIKEHFGTSIILNDGMLNRTKLRAEIFADEQKKQWLNQLLHPLIRQHILAEIDTSTSQYCLLVAPLLIENNLTAYVNRILVIDVSESCQIARTTLRDSNNAQQVQNIINSQLSRTKRLAVADDVIDNNTSNLQQVQQQVKLLHQQYLKLSATC